MPCKAKRQYLLTMQVSRYCLLALHSSIDGIRTLKVKTTVYCEVLVSIFTHAAAVVLYMLNIYMLCLSIFYCQLLQMILKGMIS